MPDRALPGDGQAWRVTSPAGVRLVRTRKGAPPAELEDAAVAVQSSAWEASEHASTAPGRLWELWALAETAQPRYGWSLLRAGLPGGPPVGWTLSIDPPSGGVQIYTWERTGDGRMRPLCSVELIAAAAERLAGDP